MAKIFYNQTINHYIHAKECPGEGYVEVDAIPNFFVPNPRLQRIEELKNSLATTDYQALKFAEGVLSEKEYAPIRAQRQAWRDEINQLEQLVQLDQNE